MGSKNLRQPKIDIGTKIKVTDDKYQHIDYPIFCLRHLDKNYHIDKCSNDEKVQFLQTLQRLSTMNWNDIQLAPKHGLGSEKISRNSIKAPIPNHITPDVNFLALRFDGKKPFVGYRSGFIFHIVYLDRDYTLYKH